MDAGWFQQAPAAGCTFALRLDAWSQQPQRPTLVRTLTHNLRRLAQLRAAALRLQLSRPIPGLELRRHLINGCIELRNLVNEVLEHEGVGLGPMEHEGVGLGPIATTDTRAIEYPARA